MKTRAVNIHTEGCDVYIGRGFGQHMNNTAIGEKGWLGNPYPLSRFSREESIDLFEKDFIYRIKTDALFRGAVYTLKGKKLGCFCKPLDCHGDIIATFLEGNDE